MSNSVRIAVTNAVLSNTGDAAILQAIRQSLERQWSPTPVEVVVFDAAAAETAAHYPEWSVRQQVALVPRRGPRAVWIVWQVGLCGLLIACSLVPWSLHLLAHAPGARRSWIGTALRELRTCSAVVSSGGTYLVDHYSFLHRYAEIRVARALGKPVLLWTQSMGPFETRQARFLARRIGRNVDAVFCRDRRSMEAWTRATASPARLELAPDAVFALEPAPHDQVSPSDVAIVSVREWSRGVDTSALDVGGYRDMMRAAVQELAASGASVQASSTCQGVPSYAYDDAAHADLLLGDLPVMIDREFHRPDELMAVVAGARVVVSTRMHLAIMALLARVPVIAVAYEFKTIELFSSLGLADFVISIEDSDVAWMRAKVQQCWHGRDAIVSEDTLQELRARAQRPAAVLRELVDERSSAAAS
ncbi:polysaccharide pyruvyl transferase family protein [Nocardioides dilutus]